MSTYIMTDIHGHYDAMRKLFEKIGFSHHDRLICAGDWSEETMMRSLYIMWN